MNIFLFLCVYLQIVIALYASTLNFNMIALDISFWFFLLFFSLSTLFLRPIHISTLLGMYLCSLVCVHYILPNYFPHDWHTGCLLLSATLSNVWHPWECSSQTSDLKKGNWAKAPAAVLRNPALGFTRVHTAHWLLPVRDTKTGPFLGDMGFFSQLILAWGLPGGLKEPSLVCVAII